MASFEQNTKVCHLCLSVLKLFRYIFHVLVWGTIALHLLVILAFSIPSVQEFMGQQAAHLLSKKLGTQVSIGRMDYKLPSHLTLYQVAINDQEDHELLRAGKLSARIDILPLTKGKISISTAQLFGTHATLYQRTADSKPNFQFVLDSLASRDTTESALDLRVNSLIMRHTSVKYDRYDQPETSGLFNPNHLHFSDISAHLILKTLTPDSLNLKVKRLALTEKSGLKIDRLAFHFEGGRENCKLSDFLLRMPGTNFQLGDMEATYLLLGSKFVKPALTYSGSIKPSTITLSDLSCLLPSLKTFQSTLSVAADFHGRRESLKVPYIKVSSTTGDISIDMEGEGRRLRQEQPVWTAHIHDLSLSAKTINFISENMKGTRIEVPEVLTRLGNIHLTGVIDGIGLDDIKTHNQWKTDAGAVDISMAMTEKKQFSGKITTKGIQLNRLLDDERFGLLATEISVKGILPSQNAMTINAEGTINQFSYNNYTYHNVAVNGSYNPKDIQGIVTIDDPNAQLTMEGLVDMRGKKSIVKLQTSVAKLSPKLINLTDKWGDAHFSGQIDANFEASNISNAVGTLDITDFLMTDIQEVYRLNKLHIASGYDNNIHYMKMNSDFGEAEITGDFNYETLTQSITNFIAINIPTLPGLPELKSNVHNNFAVKATIRKTDWLEHLLQVPLKLNGNFQLNGVINDDQHQMTIECHAPSFTYQGNHYKDARLNILSPLNTLQYDASIIKQDEDGHDLHLQVTGSAYNNNLTASLLWDNHADERMSGKVTAKANFETTLDGEENAYITIAPSHMVINGALWDIAPSQIVYHNKNIDIQHFNIKHEQQHLTLHGIASENNTDSIQVDMRDIDLDYVLDLVDFDAVAFSGLATGSGNLRGVFGDMEADANLVVNDFKFEKGRMGTLHADVVWNKEEQQIDIHAISDDGPDAITRIDGYVSPERNFIDLNIKAEGTHLDFAHSFTESFIGSVTGHGYGQLELAGPLDAINLTGGLTLNGRAYVKTLGCTYEMRNDSLRFIPNEIEFLQCPIYDARGKEGILTGGIHHKDLTNLTFDIYVKTDNLMAYDFHDFGEDTFYGTVFASGNVGIHGREGSVVIDADVTPQQGSVFVYNAASPDAINNQEFIEWNQKEQPTVVKKSQEEEDDFRSDLTMRLKINATPNASIRLLMDPLTGDYITLRGNGELQTQYYNKGGFSMFGTYRVTDGTYGLTIQGIIKKNFTFKDGGTIVFGGDPYDATLNLQAQHTVNGVSLSDLNVGRSFSNTVRVNCLMGITGQPRAPILDFDLDIPNVNADEKQMVRSVINGDEEMNQQVIYLLAVGRFYPQGANNATDVEGSQSKTSLAMQSLLSGTLSGQINNVLGQVIKSNNWNFGANISTGDEGWNNAEYEGLISGRLLNNRLLLNGQFGYRDNATKATPSFIGDFDIRYLLFPNGNLALKVYNQTNDRYFTKSSLNTQGIGIIMKKDFDGFSDLFGIKKRKTKK